jgi:hypothetical protein
MGVMEMLSEVSENESPLAQAFEADRAPEPLKVPAVEADQRAMCVRVSDVPPLVHEEAIEVMATEPPEAVPIVAETREVEPADTAVVPAAPGSAVCSSTKTPPVANWAVSMALAVVLESPVVMSCPQEVRVA